MSAAVHEPRLAETDGRTPRAGAFKRTYKACEPCRKTKAKCERDQASQSCLKCQRERRECVFPADRSTKRAKLADFTTAGPENAPRKQSSQVSVEGLGRSGRIGNHDSHEQRYGQNQALLTVSPTSSSRLSITANRLENLVSNAQANSSLDNSTSILPPLSQRSGAGFSLPSGPLPQPDGGQTQTESLTNHLQDQVIQMVVASSSDAVGLLFRAAQSSDTDGSEDPGDEETLGTGPKQSTSTNSILSPSLNTREPVSPDILQLWNQHRFVRQRWFTAREAVAYVQAFFTKLSSLSPVSDSFYADPENHRRLILEEPLLCCTVLMISSRHHQPPGVGGAVRADYIHARLWRHIEHLIQRITLGSEKYSIAKSRTFGSIQALLLITEWHPRSLHFPPEYDGWDSSLAPGVDDAFTPQERDSDAGKRWREDVFEPAKRSDRLSWMLVGLATTLAHELGVFKIMDETENAESVAARSTKLRIRRLLYLYGTQLSLRLGCTTIFPQEALQDIEPPVFIDSSTMGQLNHDREWILSKWIDITRLLSTVADVFFSSRSTTKQMLRTTRYLTLISHFQPLLDTWYKDYTDIPGSTIEDVAKKVLLVEYYYARMYIHSIAIQALVDRISNLSNKVGLWQDHEIWQSKYAQDFASVNEVRESCGKILTTAVELSDQGILQYCPVRLYLRVVSASVFLLKSISLGSRETDIVASLDILEQCVTALQQDRADDIHLSSHYATLMARHVHRFRRNFRVKVKSFVPTNITPYRTRASSPFVSTGFGAHQNPDSLRHKNQHSSQFVGDSSQGLPQNDFGLLPDPVPDGANQANFAGDEGMEDWLAQPFDPQIAPFGLDYMGVGGGIALDSLDFLWNIADPS